MNILDYIHPFFYLSVLLHSSCQGLQLWSEIHFSCFTQRVGQEIPFVHPRFGDGWVIHPTIHTHACRYIHHKTHLYTFMLSNCHFLCAVPVLHWHSLLPWLTASETQHHVASYDIFSASSLCQHDRQHESMNKSWPLNCKIYGNFNGNSTRDMSKSTGINQGTKWKSNTWYFDTSERSALLFCNWGKREVVNSTIQIGTIIAFSITCPSY